MIERENTRYERLNLLKTGLAGGGCVEGGGFPACD